MPTYPVGLLSPKGDITPVPEINHWPFIGNTDDIVSGNDGVNSGAVLTTDKGANPSSAYLFGSAEGDSMATTSSENIGKIYSITTRMKADNYSFMFINQGATYYNFFNSSTNFIHNVNGVNVQFTISPALIAFTYYDFALLRNGTAVEFYVDAVKQDITETLGANADFIFTEICKAGSFNYEGVVDNFRVYNRLLTQQELTDIANE